MKRPLSLPLATAVCIWLTAGGLFSADGARQASAPAQRLVINLNSHWLFKSGDVPERPVGHLE